MITHTILCLYFTYITSRCDVWCDLGDTQVHAKSRAAERGGNAGRLQPLWQKKKKKLHGRIGFMKQRQDDDHQQRPV